MRRSAWVAPNRPRRGAIGVRNCVAALSAVVCLLTSGVRPAEAGNDEPFAASQWGIRQVGADAAWQVTRGGGARVGIVDTGVDYGHLELSGKIVGSTRCIGTGGQVARCGGTAQDDSGHGTHVAGIVGAPLDGTGVAGVAPDASLLVVKALQADGSGETLDVAAGIDWLVSQGVNVVNLSLAETLARGQVRGSPLEAAIRRASDAGAVVVLAAGNHVGGSDSTVPFDLPAIVVGATDRNGRLARYSQPLAASIRWGMVAPGGDSSGGIEGEVVSTYWFAGRSSSYAWSEGTSMAAPHVAGAAALLAAQGVRGQAAVERLLATASPLSCGAGCRGLLDARSAVGAAVPAGTQSATSTTRVAPVPAPTTAVVSSSTPGSESAAVLPAPVPEFTDAANTTTTTTPDSVAEPVVAPAEPRLALQVAKRTHAGKLTSRTGVVTVGAAIAMLGVAAAGLWRGWRRFRADGEW